MGSLQQPVNLAAMATSLLMEHFKTVCAELGILQVSSAPMEELQSAQRKVDEAEQELSRRTSW